MALTVVVFSASHAASRGSNLISEAAIGLEAGILFAAVYVCTRRLRMVIGLLAAWNFTGAGVFGASTSAHEEMGVLISRFHGPEMLTGGAAGPEATIIAVLVRLAAAVRFLLVARREGRAARPFWHANRYASASAGIARS